jgi:hypothetical protein
MHITISTKEAGKMFRSLVSQIDRGDIDGILFNWNDSELNEDKTEIRMFPNSRAMGHGTGGVSRVKKSEFFDWLFSEAPFNTKVYGEEIREDKDWNDVIKRAREAAQMKEEIVLL